MKVRLYRGDTWRLNFTVTKTVDGSAYNLLGCAVKFTIKRNLTDPDPGVVLATLASGVSIQNAAAGTLYVILGGSQTAALVPGRTYYWDLEITDGSGMTWTPISGTIEAIADVTFGANPPA